MQSLPGPSFTMEDIEEVSLYVADPVILKNILENALIASQNFTDVKVEWFHLTGSELTQEPFYLAASGLGSNTAVLDVGDSSYWQPQPDISKVYNIYKILNSPKLLPKYSFIFGNGFSRYTGEFSELIINESFIPKADRLVSYVNKNNIIYGIQEPSYKCHVDWLPNEKSTRKSLMKRTFFLCEGVESEVLKIYAKANTSIVKSPLDFTNLIHIAIRQEFRTCGKNIALGGIFKVDTRRGWQHVVTRNDLQSSAGHHRTYCNVGASEAIISIFNSSSETPMPHRPGSSLKKSDVKQSNHYLFHKYAENLHAFYENDDAEFTEYFSPAQKLYRIINTIE